MNESVLPLLEQHGTVALAAVAIGLVVRLAKAGQIPALARVPARWRPLLVLVLGQVAGAVEAAARGMSWREAIVRGLVASAIAALGHGCIIEGLRDGREVGEAKEAAK